MNVTYSTGPLENQAPNRSRTVFTKVLNNNSSTSITARIKVFRLNGTKTLIQNILITVPPNSSRFVVKNLATNVQQFEVQIKVSTNCNVLVGVFGKTGTGNLNPTHRVVHSELTRIL